MQGFRLLPEWAPQSAVMLTWPHQATDWADFLPDVEQTFRAIAKQLSQYADVVVVCHSNELLEQLRLEFQQLSIENAHFVVIANNDSWARDHGPITVVDSKQQLHWLDFQFTGWGDKFTANLDNAINQQLATAPFVTIQSCLTQALVLEGGAIETDGNGCFLATRHCLLHENRQNSLSQAQFEQQLTELFGVHKFLWLEHGYLAGDDTDAHIDTLARFTPNKGIVYVHCDDPLDEHYAALQAMASQLEGFTDSNNVPFTLFPLPWPSAKYSPEGERLPASYANYLIINGAILMPTYGDAKDAAALDVLKAAYPGYQVHGIDCQALIRQYGSLHCVTMQLPKGCIREKNSVLRKSTDL